MKLEILCLVSKQSFDIGNIKLTFDHLNRFKTIFMFPMNTVSETAFPTHVPTQLFNKLFWYKIKLFCIIIFSAEKISDQMILYHGLYTSKNYELDFKNCDELDSASGITFCTLSRGYCHMIGTSWHANTL